MNSFDGYVLSSELSKKASVSLALFRQTEGILISKMGGLNALKIDSLPTKYKKFAKKCTELSDYISVTYLNDLLGLSEGY